MSVHCFLHIPFAVDPGGHGKILKRRSHSVLPPRELGLHDVGRDVDEGQCEGGDGQAKRRVHMFLQAQEAEAHH